MRWTRASRCRPRLHHPVWWWRRHSRAPQAIPLGVVHPLLRRRSTRPRRMMRCTLYKATRCACAAHWEGGVRPRTANAIAIMDLDNIISPSFFPTGSSCKAWNRGRSDGYWRLQTATAVEESPSAMISAQPGHDSFRGVRWLQGWWAGSESGTGGRDQTA